MGYIRDHFVRDFTASRQEGGFDDGVFRKANEDVLVEVKSAGVGRQRRRAACKRLVGEVERLFRGGAEAGAHVPGVQRRLRQDAGGAARQGEPGSRLRQGQVLYLKESSIPSTATPRSSSTTPSAFPVDLTRTCAASAASRSTSRPSTRRCRGSASGARGVASSRWRRASSTPARRPSSTATTRSTLPAKVVALYREGAQVQALKSGDAGIVVLDRTPFYAESGGQVGDRGELVGAGGTFEVADTQKIQADVFGHHGTLKTGTLKVGDKVEAQVDMALRTAHHAQPLGHAPHAQGAARGARAARAAEGLAGRRGQDALRLRARQAADRRADPRGRAARERRDPAEHADARAGHADRRGEEVGRDDAVRREVRRRGARARHRHARASSAAARTSRAPATSASSRSIRRAASPRASAASRRPPAATRWR